MDFERLPRRTSGGPPLMALEVSADLATVLEVRLAPRRGCVNFELDGQPIASLRAGEWTMAVPAAPGHRFRFACDGDGSPWGCHIMIIARASGSQSDHVLYEAEPVGSESGSPAWTDSVSVCAAPHGGGGTSSD